MNLAIFTILVFWICHFSVFRNNLLKLLFLFLFLSFRLNLQFDRYSNLIWTYEWSHLKNIAWCASNYKICLLSYHYHIFCLNSSNLENRIWHTWTLYTKGSSMYYYITVWKYGVPAEPVLYLLWIKQRRFQSPITILQKFRYILGKVE